MIRSLPRLLRNRAFRTATAFALAFLLTTAVPAAPSLENPPLAHAKALASDEEEVKDTHLRDKDSFIISVEELIHSGIVLLFLAIAIAMIPLLFKKLLCKDAEAIERITIVIILVMGSLFLVTTGYDSAHIAPAFALFGTIGGYFIGQIMPWRSRRQEKEKPEGSDGQQ